MNRTILIAAGAIVAIGIFAYTYNIFTASPLEVVPIDQQTDMQAPENAPTTTDPQSFEDGTLETVSIGGEAEGRPITNVAEAVSAIDGLDTASLDAQLDSDLAEIDASFQ